MSEKRKKNKLSPLDWQYRLFKSLGLHRSLDIAIPLPLESFMEKVKAIETLEGFDPTSFYINANLPSPTMFQLRLIRGNRREEVAYIEGYLEEIDNALTLKATVYPGESGISRFLMALPTSPFILLLLVTAILLIRDITQISSQTGSIFLVSLFISFLAVGVCTNIVLDRNDAYAGFRKAVEEINNS